MITLFTTAKPFTGNAAVTQYNTLAGWRTLLPDGEVLLVGEETGAAEAARELGVRLIPDIERNKFGTPLLRSIFSAAAANASFSDPVYANADILFTNRSSRAVRLVANRRRPFLLIGRRLGYRHPRTD